jgi:serine/threonine-protein kinase
LDPLRAVSDVAEFEQAIEAGELERAVGLYRGRFLEGFHQRGADEFEAWARSERERLERAYDRALERLAEEARAKGEVGEAVRWLRRRVELDPFAAGAERGLMEALAASGDRAGALRAARAYAVRLKEEYGLEPEVEVVELEQRLRSEPALASPAPRLAVARRPRASIISAVKDRFEARRTEDRNARWIPEPTPLRLSLVAVALALLAGVPLLFQAFRDTGRPTPGEAMAEAAAPGIAVLPFQATGPGLDLWREGMIDLLSTNLDGAGGLRAIDSRTVLARWGETVPAGAVADLATSLEAARKTGARWAVVGAAVGLGSQVRLTADVYELESGRNLGQAHVQGAPDSVYMLVDRLAIDVLRTVLGPRRPDLPRVELARVTTSSLPALKAYLEGELLYRRADIPAAIEAYRRAVEADTTFALAYMRLAQTISWLPPEVQAEEGLDYYDRRAVQYADRLPEREAILVRAQSALYAASLAMLEPLRQATRRFPDDPELWYLLADYYFFLGDQILLPDDEVRRAFDRLLAMDPTFALFYFSPIVDAFQPPTAPGRSTS